MPDVFHRFLSGGEYDGFTVAAAPAPPSGTVIQAAAIPSGVNTLSVKHLGGGVIEYVSNQPAIDAAVAQSNPIYNLALLSLAMVSTMGAMARVLRIGLDAHANLGSEEQAIVDSFKGSWLAGGFGDETAGGIDSVFVQGVMLSANGIFQSIPAQTTATINGTIIP